MTEEKKSKAKEGAHYVSTKDTYTGGKVVKAGEPFVSDKEPGDDWEEVTPKAAAAITAATNAIPSDEVFDAASKYAVEAWCLMKGIDIRELKSKEDFVAAAKAFNEPSL